MNDADIERLRPIVKNWKAMEVLNQVWRDEENGGKPYSQKLCKSLVIPPTRMSFIINCLDRKGLLKRERSNGGIAYLSLTPLGLEICANYTKIIN